MDKHSLRQHLHDIAQEEIPDDMNLLPEIKQQLHKQSSPNTMRPFVNLARIAAVFVIFAAAATGGYALFYQVLYTDPTIPEQDLAMLNESQTVEDVTLTLDWAYADAHRAAITYTAEYLETTPFTNAFSPTEVTLETADGTVIPRAFGGGGGGGGGGNPSRIDEQPLLIRNAANLNFDTSVIEGEPEILDLTLTIRFAEGGENPMFGNPMGMPASGGSGGGGGGGGAGQPPAQPTPAFDMDDIPERVFQFEFSVPFRPALEVQAQPSSITSNDVTVDILNVRYTPSLVKFDLCYNAPDTSGEWFVTVLVATDDGFARNAGMTNSPSTLADGRTCLNMATAVAISNEADAFTIEVVRFYQPANSADVTQDDPVVAESAAYFAEQGIIVQIDIFEPGGFGHTVKDYPDDMSRDEANARVGHPLLDAWYEGDWEFTIPLR